MPYRIFYFSESSVKIELSTLLSAFVRRQKLKLFQSYTALCTRSAGMSDSPREVVLSPEDIPGASLSKPYEKHTVAALRWWLLCRGVKAPTSWKKNGRLSTG